LKDDACVSKVDLGADFSMEHLTQFVNLWCLLHMVDLNEEDTMTWKLTENGQYSAKLAYDLQFLVSTYSPMYKFIWKAWAPPKFKTFAWTTLQKRIWMTGRFGEGRVGKLWALPFMKASYGVGAPSLCPLPLHHSSLEKY
jgi:hypothetical protein